MLSRPFATLATMLAIATTLLVPILLLLFSSSLSEALDRYSNSPRLTAYLIGSSNEVMMSEVSERLLARDDIGLIELIPKQSAFTEFVSSNDFGALLVELEHNPLPDGLIITPLVSEPSQLEELANELRAFPEIELVQLDTQWIMRLQGFTQLVRTMGLLIGTAAMLGFFLVIANTIKISVQQSEDEIRVLKLIGAPDSFILRPLLYTGLLYGFCAAMLAAIFQYAIFGTFNVLIGEFLSQYNTSARSEFSLNLGLIEFLLLLLVSSCTGMLAAGSTAYSAILKLEP